MPTARLHDGAPLDVSVVGDGPAVLLPISTRVIDGDLAEQMRAWGADPALGHTLAMSLADAGFRVVTADYEGHCAEYPKPLTLNADTVAKDLLAIADAAAADRFSYYGYSWLALAGLQLAIRTDRLTALAMGGFPPLGGPYGSMLTVTRAAHRMALANVDREAPTEPQHVEPGDWDAVEVTQTPEQSQQYLTLYESLQDFDEAKALDQVTIPGLAFAGSSDNITYGPQWDDAHVAIADPLKRHCDELTKRGWTVVLIPEADHIRAMQTDQVLPILTPWLAANVAR
jgi:pimeloyl-ACP methyl ester carboxylesterase